MAGTRLLLSLSSIYYLSRVLLITMSARKRKESRDGGDEEEPPMIKNITTSVTSLNDNKYLVAYTVAFTKPCRCFENSNQRARIKINSEKEFFADGADTAVLMMNKTINVLGEHKRSKQYDGIDLCGLDLRGGIGASYMIRDESSASLWRLVWAAADNTIIKKQFEFYKRSQGQLTQYKEQKSEILSKG